MENDCSISSTMDVIEIFIDFHDDRSWVTGSDDDAVPKAVKRIPTVVIPVFDGSARNREQLFFFSTFS